MIINILDLLEFANGETENITDGYKLLKKEIKWQHQQK